ncbi:hypothetical protein [Pyrococcus kukulkanii]|uniref:Uncharacterized protein n=1 Tax=Pyrococcus kukulkanii TaxID=1609559 RepID=A0ABV4T5W8_9EURY
MDLEHRRQALVAPPTSPLSGEGQGVIRPNATLTVITRTFEFVIVELPLHAFLTLIFTIAGVVMVVYGFYSRKKEYLLAGLLLLGCALVALELGVVRGRVVEVVSGATNLVGGSP